MKRALLGGLCLLVVVLPGRAQSDAQKKATIAYLRNLQDRDGGFRSSPREDRTQLPATTAALRALKYFGGEPRDRSACVAFVKGCFDRKEGGFGIRPGVAADFRSTCTGIMAVVDLKMPTEPYAGPVVAYLDKNSKTFEEIRLAVAAFESIGKKPPHADDWMKQIAKLRHADGTYGKGAGVARDTGGAAVAVLRLGGKVEHSDAVLKALNAGQRKDGGFGKESATGSDLETTYRVVRAFHMLKIKPPHPALSPRGRGLGEGPHPALSPSRGRGLGEGGAERCRAFIGRCRQDDGGYGVAPGQPSSAAGTYFAAIILHWLDEP